MDRRAFISASSGAAAATLLASTERTQAQGRARDFYELRTYAIDTEEQKRVLGAYLEHVAIPAFNRIDIAPVGVFEPMEGQGALVVLLRHPSAESFATATHRLLADDVYLTEAQTSSTRRQIIRPIRVSRPVSWLLLKGCLFSREI